MRYRCTFLKCRIFYVTYILLQVKFFKKQKKNFIVPSLDYGFGNLFNYSLNFYKLKLGFNFVFNWGKKKTKVFLRLMYVFMIVCMCV